MANVGHRQVGEFISPRRMVKTAKNPLDRTTIVSIYPRDFRAKKETIFPGQFFIPKGSIQEPSITIIEPSSWWRDMDVEQPLIEIPVPSITLAESIINDFCNAMLGASMDHAMPGLFYVPGVVNIIDVRLKYKDKLNEVAAKQKNWYAILVKLADSLWARTNNNPLVIWEEMRLAAVELGLDTKPWIKDIQALDMVKCFGCGNLRNPAYPICPSCRVIDQGHPLAKDLKFAQ